MKYTEKYGFKKPDVDEFYDVNVFNENMDKVEEELINLSDSGSGSDLEEFEQHIEEKLEENAQVLESTKQEIQVMLEQNSQALDETLEEFEQEINQKLEEIGGGFALNGFFDVAISEMKSKSMGTLPYYFYESGAVVLNGEIHILGSGHYSSSYYKNHYKWNGSSWTSVSTLPTTGCDTAVVLNDEIHIFGEASTNGISHYKWNGSSWIELPRVPIIYKNSVSSGYLSINQHGSVVVLDGEIHIVGCYYDEMDSLHYKWNGDSWVRLPDLPYEFTYGSALVVDRTIYMVGGGLGSNDANATTKKFYKLYKEYIKKAYLPKGVRIYLDIPIQSAVKNCTLQSDKSVIVSTTGEVRFKTHADIKTFNVL